MHSFILLNKEYLSMSQVKLLLINLKKEEENYDLFFISDTSIINS